MVNFGLHNFLLMVAVHIETYSWLYIGFFWKKKNCFFPPLENHILLKRLSSYGGILFTCR